MLPIHLSKYILCIYPIYLLKNIFYIVVVKAFTIPIYLGTTATNILYKYLNIFYTWKL